MRGEGRQRGRIRAGDARHVHQTAVREAEHAARCVVDVRRNRARRDDDAAVELCARSQLLGEPRLATARLGLEHQESPSLNIVDEAELMPGMVFTPEPRFVRDGHFIMVEEDVVITEHGMRKLSTGCETLYTIDV